MKIPKTVAGWCNLLIIAAGIVLRIKVYLDNRSLFLDEANLARNLAERPLGQLFLPLDYEQYAPPLFLAIQKLNTLWLGDTEYGLRLFPLLAGIAALVLFYQVCNQLIRQPWFCTVLLFLFAFSEMMIRYAGENKQYSWDTAWTLFLVLLSLQWKPEQLTTKKQISWALVGAIGIWGSMPSVFVLAGIGIYYLWNYWKSTDFASLFRFTGVILIWLLSFGIYFLSFLRTDIGSDYLQNYHAGWFLPLTPGNAGEWKQLGSLLLSFFRIAVGYTVLAYIAGIGFFFLGLWNWWKGQDTRFLLLSIPILCCLLASGFGQYSLIPRLTLFFIPLLLLIIGMGMDGLVGKPSRRSNWITGLLLVVWLPILPLREGLSLLSKPLQVEELWPLLVQLKQEASRQDIILVDHEAVPAFSYYQDLHAEALQLEVSSLQLLDWQTGIGAQVGPKKGRYWLVFSHVISAETRNRIAGELEVAQRKGKLIKQYEEPGAVVYGFEVGD